MKKLLSTLLTIVLLTTSMIVPNTLAFGALIPGANVLSNPGFESPAGDNWVTYDANGYSTDYWIYDHYAGTACARLAINGYTNAQQTVSLVNGQQYYFSAYMKATDKDATGGNIMFYDGAAYHKLNPTTFSISIAEGWKKIEYYYTYNGLTAASAKLVIQPLTGNGWVVLVDDVVLAPMVSDSTSVTGVALDKHNLTLPVGVFDTLTATVLPIDAANKAVTWTSSTEAVATVSSLGVVTAVSEGSAVITVTTTDGTFTDTCNVTVSQRLLGSSLITNNGFEDGMTGWIADSVSAESGVTSTISHSGSKSYKLLPTQPWASVVSTTTMLLKTNEFYYFSFYVKAEGEFTSRGDVLLVVGTNYYYVKTEFDVSNLEWTKVEGVFKYSGAESIGSLAIRPCNTYGSNAYIDDVVFTQILPADYSAVTFTNYQVDESYLVSKLSLNMNTGSFLSGIGNTSGKTLKLYDKNRILKVDGTIIGTGTILEVEAATSKVEYALIIYGDINGNGDIELNDLVDIKLHLLKTTELMGIYKKAANVNKDSGISISDLLMVKKQLLGISTISQ